ncbi:hypothetical protein [Paucibacter sp. DJ2R-2]|uniref:hypothetical protein n=1 Tax=Paucibacter sp. DJ2R-2 TaxID=2893558 RepID=UPI0021E3B140|nr:hypothetical protein [Paucibacter sp. DJ2R-2]MCV2438662.1 hypothetical protein [Paucibacter sp. DJ2R-2]
MQKVLKPSAKRLAAEDLIQDRGLTVSKACGNLRLSRMAYNKPAGSAVTREAEVIDALTAIVEISPRWEIWKCFDRLRQNWRRWNHKRERRAYCQRELNIRKRTKKRIQMRDSVPLQASALVNRG